MSKERKTEHKIVRKAEQEEVGTGGTTGPFATAAQVLY